MDKIIIAEGEFFPDFFDRFISFLKFNCIHYQYEKNPDNAVWLFDIDGDKCILKSIRKEKLAYLEGYLPEFQGDKKWACVPLPEGFPEEVYLSLKSDILLNIQRKFAFKPSDFFTTYDDYTTLTSGPFTGYWLQNIPAKRLISLGNQSSDRNLRNYVILNIERLKKRAENELNRSKLIKDMWPKFSKRIEAGPVTFKCRKKTFATKKMALEAIVKNPRKTKGKERKMPIRAYECRKCSGWHLTSKTVEEYKENVERFN